MRLRTTLNVAATCSLLALLPPTRAHADERSDAARLFKEGQELMKAQRFADACPKFEDSQKLDAQLGTVLNLAFCREKLGSTWLSWLAYRDAELRADSVGKKDRADFARQHLADLEKNLPKLVLDCGPDKVDLVTVEERTVPGATNGQPFTAEPGRRTFKFEKAGKKPGATELVVQERSRNAQHVACPALEDLPAPTPAPVTPQEGDKPPEPAPPPPSHTAAYVSFGVGAAGLVVGTVFGALTLSEKADADKLCNAQTKVCSGNGKSMIDTANTYSWVSNVGFGVGIVGVALGAYFLFTTPSAPASANAKVTALPRVLPTVDRSGAGAAFYTTF